MQNIREFQVLILKKRKVAHMNAISPLHSLVSVANSVILLLFWTNAKKVAVTMALMNRPPTSVRLNQ